MQHYALNKGAFHNLWLQMGSKKPNAFRNFLSKNIDNALALAVIIVIMFLIVARFQLAEGTILFGDFVPTLELR